MNFFLALVLSIICGISFVVCMVDRQCSHQGDCEVGECCVQVNCITPSRCKPLRKKGELCFPNPIVEGGKQPLYRFACPCADGVQCQAYSAEKSNRNRMVYNYRCQS